MIYLDHNASTPLAPEVTAAMQAALSDGFGNPSSPHWAGVPARALVETARADVAALLGCAAYEIVFTSGGTESNNLALKGVFYASNPSNRPEPAHLISSAIEHPANNAPLRFLERLGARVTWLPVDSSGQVDPNDLRLAIGPDTILVSLMHANNEVGSIQPIAECAAIAREHGVLFHTDAAQSVGKIPTRVDALGVDLLSLAGHKFQAPKGVGAIYVRRGLTLEPLLHGAGHEGGRRAGTESALLATGLGAACRLADDLSPMARVEALRERLWQGLHATLVALVGTATAGYQTWLQAQPEGSVSCLGPDMGPIEQVVEWLGRLQPTLFMATGFCEDVALVILGLSLAQWSLLAFLLGLGLSLWLLSRSRLE